MPIYNVRLSWDYLSDNGKTFKVRKLAVVDASSIVKARDRVSRYWLSKYDPEKSPNFTIESCNESESIHMVIPHFIPNKK